MTFKFKPPLVDNLLKDIGALKGIGQWIESNWECKLQGGFIEPEVKTHLQWISAYALTFSKYD